MASIGSLPYRRQAWLEAMRGSKRSRPQQPDELRRWISSDYVRMRDALLLLGEAKVDGWNGDECFAERSELPPDPPWQWTERQHSPDCLLIINDDGDIAELPEGEAVKWWGIVEPVLIQEWEEEKAARTRWVECNNMMRDLLSRDCITAYILESDGDLHEIPVQTWLSDKGGIFIRMGIANLAISSGYGGSYKVQGPIILDHDFINYQKSNSDLTEVTIAPLFDTSAFPYLAFMLHAVTEAPFNKGGRTSKKIVKEWIESNWPAELGESTPAKVNYMATFLRKPEDEKGGNHGKGLDN